MMFVGKYRSSCMCVTVCVCVNVCLSPGLCAGSVLSGPGMGTLRVGVGGSVCPFLMVTVDGLGETGGFRDFLASIHSQLSLLVSVLSETSDTGLRLRTTPPFCCGSPPPFWLLGESDWLLLWMTLSVCSDVRGLLRMVSEPVVMVTTVVATGAGASESVARGRGFLRSVAMPSVISVAEETTVERGRGSGRCWAGCRGNRSVWLPGRPSGPLMVLRRLKTSSSSDPRPPAPAWRRRVGGLTWRS